MKVGPRATRLANVYVPKTTVLPEVLVPPPPLGDLPPPHVIDTGEFHSWRRHPRAHHRISFRAHFRKESYEKRQVRIAIRQSAFPAFQTHYTVLERPGYEEIQITHHFDPERKVAHSMNVKKNDSKHGRRQANDDSRADVLRHLDFSRPAIRRGMYGVLRHSDLLGEVQDTAIAIYNAREI